MSRLLRRLQPSAIDLKTRVVALLHDNPFLEPSARELELRFGEPTAAVAHSVDDLRRAGVIGSDVIGSADGGEDRIRFQPAPDVLEEAADLARAQLEDRQTVRRQVVELEAVDRLRTRLAVTRDEVVAILEMAPSGVVLLSPFGHLLKCNGLARDLLGLPSETAEVDVCGTLGLDLADVLDREVVVEVDSAEGRPPLEVRSRPFRVSGSDAGAMLTIEDISRRRELEREAADLRERFFSMIRHELRRPLLTVERFLEGAASGGDVDGLREARHSAGHLAQMVDDMLLLARLERDPFAVEPTGRVSVRHLLAGCHMAARGAAEEKGVRLEVDLPGELVIPGDERRLSQVVGNLVDNAVKFTPPGGAVRVTCAVSGGDVRVRVEDSGPGIPRAERAKVLETFYQVESGDARRPGLGLGLAISSRVVEAHGGELRIEDAALGGARILVRLPAGTKHAQP